MKENQGSSTSKKDVQNKVAIRKVLRGKKTSARTSLSNIRRWKFPGNREWIAWKDSACTK